MPSAPVLGCTTLALASLLLLSACSASPPTVTHSPALAAGPTASSASISPLATASSTSSSSATSAVSSASSASSANPLAAAPQCKVGSACGAVCVDTQVTATDCGACGHSCLGGACAAGSCGEVLLMKGKLTPTSVVVVGANAYTINSTVYLFKIETVPLAGGEQKVIIDGLANGSNTLATDGEALYFGNVAGKAYGGEVYRLPLDGSNKLQTLKTGGDGGASITSVALGPDDVYFQTNEYLAKVPKKGGKVTTLASVGTRTPGLALHGDSLYFAGTESIFRVPIGGGKPTALAKLQYQPSEPVVDDAFVYYATGDGALKKVPLGGGAPVILAKDQGGAHALTLEGGDLVFATATKIRRVPTAGGEVTDVVTGQTKLQGFALTPKAIFWGRGIAGSSHEGELVMRAR